MIEKIPEKIRNLRLQKGLTQEYMADKLHIDTVNYGRLERGKSSITIDRLWNISQILEVSISSFFEIERGIQEYTEILMEILTISQILKAEIEEIKSQLIKK